MNCQKFEEVVSDIAREQILDVSVRSDALAHCHGCEPCAVRLEDELAITHRLRDFAGSFDSIGAPARVEAQMLAAFELHTLRERQPVVISRQRYWISAIAALVLIVFALSIIRWRQAVPAAEKAAAGLIAAGGLPADSNSPSPTVSVVGQDDRNQVLIPPKRAPTIRHSRRNAKSTTNQSKPTDNSEIATDFLPVTYGGTANLADGGTMVRVELPRSAMASFGLPVNMDRANERVKADVLLGVDGLAHAIRFVAMSNVKR
jgi:hypothetical protein